MSDRRSRIAAALFALLLVGLLASLALLLLVPSRVEEELAPRESVLVDSPERMPLESVANVAATVAVDPSPTLVMGGSLQGIVTSVNFSAGSGIVSGQPLFSVNEVSVIAAASSAPFYRSLGLGDSGEDVAALRHLLVETGYLSQPGSDAAKITPAQVRAIQRLGKELGFTFTDGNPVRFDPAWTVWIPRRDVLVSESLLRVGSPAPAQGGDVASLAPQIRDLTLTEALDEVQDATRDLVVGDAAFPVTDNRVEIPADTLQALRASVVVADGRDRGDLTVQIRTTWKTAPFSLPATAILSSASGAACVVVSTGGETEEKSVSIVGGQTATSSTLIQGLDDDDRVVLNPRASGTRQCS